MAWMPAYIAVPNLLSMISMTSTDIRGLIPKLGKSALFTILMPVAWYILGTATIRTTQWIINASYNQHQRFFHISPEPWML
jgi:hypothetical protein